MARQKKVKVTSEIAEEIHELKEKVEESIEAMGEEKILPISDAELAEKLRQNALDPNALILKLGKEDTESAWDVAEVKDLGLEKYNPILPPLDLEYIRSMFKMPKCKIDQSYMLLKCKMLLEEAAIGFFYALPHTVHLQRVLLELELVWDACVKAVKDA